MYDVIIIGGGPAGLTAALYSSRRAMKTLVLTRDIGGQASKASDIENYPGFKKIKGPELSMNIYKQAEAFGSEIKFEDTKKLNKKENYFVVETASNKYEGRSLILAFGKKPRELNVPGEEEFKGRGVSYCATCDAPFFKNKDVAVVGGGNSAVEAAILAAKTSKKVYLIYRGDTLSAEQILIDQAKNSDVEFILNNNVAEINGSKTVESIKLTDGKKIDLQGIIVEIGYVIDRSLANDFVETNESNQIIINEMQETNVPGVFAAGDVTSIPFKQVVIAAGEGAKAALSAYDYIQKQEGKKGILVDWHKNK